eukprot:15472567-Alexandrium_andersonii.AAC.1
MAHRKRTPNTSSYALNVQHIRQVRAERRAAGSIGSYPCPAATASASATAMSMPFVLRSPPMLAESLMLLPESMHFPSSVSSEHV